jgi:hypothetical protein
MDTETKPDGKLNDRDSAIAALVDSYYDLQDVRIRCANRLRAALRDERLDPARVQMLHEGLAEALKAQERRIVRLCLSYLKNEPVWNDWLKGVRGIGPVLAAGLLAHVGYCERSPTVSALWAYAGQHVVNGEAPKRKRGEKANWNASLRVLVWKIGQSFVKVGDGYRALYLAEKARLRKLHPELAPYDPPRKRRDGGPLLRFTDGHVAAMAERKARKLFLSHYWDVARRIKGLPVREPYVLEQMGHTTRVPVILR